MNVTHKIKLQGDRPAFKNKRLQRDKNKSGRRRNRTNRKQL